MTRRIITLYVRLSENENFFYCIYFFNNPEFLFDWKIDPLSADFKASFARHK